MRKRHKYTGKRMTRRVELLKNGVVVTRKTRLTRVQFRKQYLMTDFRYDYSSRKYVEREQLEALPSYGKGGVARGERLYRTTITYLYTDKKSRKEEVRIHIYTEEPTMSFSECDDMLNRFYDDIGFGIDVTSVIGNELNEEVDYALERTNVFFCHFLRDGKVLIKKEYRR